MYELIPTVLCNYQVKVEKNTVPRQSLLDICFMRYNLKKRLRTKLAISFLETFMKRFSMPLVGLWYEIME